MTPPEKSESGETVELTAAIGDGILMAIQANADLIDMELMQFWPTPTPRP